MQTAADAVRISLLGPLEVSDAAGRPVRVGGHRVRALLILLALNPGRVIAASAIIERLWPDERPGDAANALQSLVSRLRVALRQGGVPDGVLESSPTGYRLAVPPDAVDAVAFEAQARAGARALALGDAGQAADLLRAALARWRGSALTDVAGEEFALAAAARLAELRAAATLDRIEADLAVGAVDALLVSELRELTTVDPLAERPAGLLMRALAAGGRQAEALDVYQQTRERLADGLGVSPSPQLEQTYLALLRQEIPPSGGRRDGAGGQPPGPASAMERAPGDARPPIPADPGAWTRADAQARVPAAARERAEGRHQAGQRRAATVPRPPTSFVGRDEDVAAVLTRLAAGRLVTLTGPGGVGKTRLAAESASRLTVPAWLAELAPVTDPAEVPYAVLDALRLRGVSAGHRPEPAGDPVDRLCDALHDRDAVIILDNCEHLIDTAAALAARLLADCPGVRVLATSREPLQIPGEALHVVAALAVPPAGPRHSAAGPAGLTEVARYPAVRLFADRAAAVHAGFELDAASAAPVARICRALDGMPLAIELAAPWLRTLTPAQLAERLDDRFALLTGGSRTALPRHQTLRAVVDWSWDLMSEPERALARRLAIFPGGATLAGAEGVASVAGPSGLGAIPARSVLPVLAGLVGKSILTRVTAGVAGDDPEPRYRMLETVRAYGTERLAEAGDDAAARAAFARYYLDFAETADPLLRTAAQGRWYHRIAAEQDNLTAAIRWAISHGEVATALRFVRALGYYWVRRGQGEADAITREVLALPVPPLTRLLAEGRVICALLAAGMAWEIERVRGPLTEAIAALEGFTGEDWECHPLVSMAAPLLAQYDGATDQAKVQFERYLSARDPWLRAMGKVSVATYEASLGRMDKSEAYCQSGIAELRALGERWGVAVALAQLAELTETRGDHAASIAALAESAQVGRELGVWGDLTYVEARLALVRARAGDRERAHTDFARVEQAVAARGGHVDTDHWVRFMRAELAWRDGDYAAAARYCENLLALIAVNRARWWESLRALAKARLGLAWLRQGDPGRCRALLLEAVDAAASWWEHPSLAAAIDGCAAYVLSAGGPDGAETAARLLGAGYAVRGAFDESSPDAGPARDAATAALGPARFRTAYDSSRALGYAAAAELARATVSATGVDPVLVTGLE